ncbi:MULTISPECIES: hypothetical protein [Chryseobacterium]|uniref:Lipoprotein n=1 Tax=Chryseobacterium camelliae TaxID=1265445 RepID=A0ABU0TJX1_9FLAO|nr:MULTISPECIES: hypothetical protein [Chryseobacterium]MDT3408815.1 hypothetical protein [Pseudacidovorax intermedius]MDQ1097329.1 hypothetical protein [Chryseobacterium camelliae]MDQ1101261.1 hypothetical protein [Chryseobacterium sp. SORGH_AS_1048]MDR6084706.1 hypothetical protein [Chryseobacterium sp. SORGH_AS_0909]MDR6132979.1 hypothetical protein [Chryseobacterium sp. SORGH_AS_1175]
MRKLLYPFLVLTLMSCAGFKNVNSNSGGFHTDNLDRINGSYKNYPAGGQLGYIDGLADIFDRNTNMFIFKHKYDGRAVHLNLTMINERKINVKIFKQTELLFDKDLKVELKDDGYLYLKEKRFMMQGIPLVLGGWNIQKSRFTVDQDNHLRVQTNYFFCNGAFIVMSDWKTFHYDFKFEKLNP